jgi:hypothetical protein
MCVLRCEICSFPETCRLNASVILGPLLDTTSVWNGSPWASRSVLIVYMCLADIKCIAPYIARLHPQSSRHSA